MLRLGQKKIFQPLRGNEAREDFSSVKLSWFWARERITPEPERNVDEEMKNEMVESIHRRENLSVTIISHMNDCHYVKFKMKN